jgi:histidinol-phosphate aminotransferase
MSMITNIFKPYILNSGGYSGGKSTKEVSATSSKIYKLSSNENLLGGSPKAIQAMKDSIIDVNLYPDGTPYRLKNALAKHYSQELLPDQFIIGNGGSEIIDLIARAFLDESTECIVSDPYFTPYRMFVQWVGGHVIDVPLVLPYYSLDVEGILAAINPKTRVIFLTSPNNPTGTYIPKKQLENLLERIPDHIVVVYDEVYHHFAEAKDFTTAIKYVKKGHNIIAINSFSKTYGLASLRLGYAYTTLEISQYIHKLCRPFYINSININAGIAALEDVEFVHKTVQHVQIERKRICSVLKELDIRFWPSQANFVMIQSPPHISNMVDYMMTKGVMVRSAFGAPDCIRITIGTSEANDTMLNAISHLIK